MKPWLSYVWLLFVSVISTTKINNFKWKGRVFSTCFRNFSAWVCLFVCFCPSILSVRRFTIITPSSVFGHIFLEIRSIFFFQRIYNHGSRRLTLVNTVSSPCLSLGGWKEILKNCSLMRITIFAIRRGEGCILGEAFTWGDLLFFLNIFVFVILWSFVKE